MPFNSSFTTRASATPDLTNPAVTAVSPVNSAAGVPVNTTVVFTISKPLNPTTVVCGTGNDSFALFANISGLGNVLVPGSIAVSGNTVTITPTSPFPGGTSVTDQAGNLI